MKGKKQSKPREKKVRKFKISWTFWVSFLVSFFAGNGYLFLLYTLGIVLHELAHIYAAKKLGYSLSKFELSLLGASMNLSEENFYANDELIISLAGPMCSLSVFILSCCAWWMMPVLYGYTFDFAVVNLFIFVTNILPLYSLDGGRILVCLIEKFKTRKAGVKLVKTIGVIFSLLLFLGFLLSCFIQINFSLGLLAIFLFLSSTSITGGRFEKIAAKNKLDKLKSSLSLENKTFIFSDEARLIDLYRKLDSRAFTGFIIKRKNGKILSFDETMLFTLLEKYSAVSKLSELNIA